MKNNTVIIRSAVPADAEDILHIYRYYVENTAITFEYDVPSVADFQERIVHTLEQYPYLVAVEHGTIVGYAYAGPLIPRSACDWSVETSIYLARDGKGRGLGRRLYEALEKVLGQMGIVNLYACIACPEVEDEYLTNQSTQFHAHLGYAKAGEFHRCGYKFGRWYNVVWMEKHLGPHLEGQPPVVSYPQLSNKSI